MKMPQKSDVLSNARRYSGFYKVDLLMAHHEKFMAADHISCTREVVRRGEIAIIAPYDPIRDVVVLTCQWRIGAVVARELPHCPSSLTPWVFETPAGYVDEGETPIQAAHREAKEETGCEPIKIEEIGCVLTNPGLSDEIAYLFYAEVDAPIDDHISGLQNEGEDILVSAKPAQEVFDMMDAWEIQKATSLLALNWLRINRPRLRQSALSSSI